MLTPKRLLIGSVRADWQVNPSNTFIARYDFNDNRLRNQGVGGFNLPDRASNSNATEHSLRFTNTMIVSKSAINQARLGLTLQRTDEGAVSSKPAILVLGAFATGGAFEQFVSYEQERIEFADSVSLVVGKHDLKFGIQVFGKHINDARSSNHNGTFTFGGGIAPKLNSKGGIVSGPQGSILENISGLEQYRRTLQGLPGGSPTQFSIRTGNPAVGVTQWVGAGFIQDELKLRSNVLLSLGLRYEGQTSPVDVLSMAPRLGLAYSPDKQRHWVLRLRAGIFYERLIDLLVLETERLDGLRQQQITINSPSFPDPFKGGKVVDTISTVRRLDSRLRSPATLQTQAGFERQLPRGWKVELSHYFTRGWSNLRSRNINAPIIDAATVDPLTAPRPFGKDENILQFESSGRTQGHVLFLGANQMGNRLFNLYSGYLLFDFHSDTDSPFMFPQSSYDLRGEWTSPLWQSRHRAFAGGSINLPWKLLVSPSFNVASGTRFNITTGRDNNGDSIFNDRPSLADKDDSEALATSFGTFNVNSINGRLRRNAGINKPTYTLDLNLSRAFRIGKKGQNSDYQLTLNVHASNLLNHTNLFPLNGVLLSPFFGRANNAAPARRIEAGARIVF